MKKELHFYTNLSDELQVSDDDITDVLSDINSTQNALRNPNMPVIRTTQIALLVYVWDYISKGYDIYVHNNETEFKITEGMFLDGKIIRRGADMLWQLLSGSFGELI